MHRPHPLFDTTYYLENNRDVAAAGVDPFIHFITHGIHEGRWPNAFFDPKYYLQNNPDVAAAGDNPLVHYLLHGASEGRNPSSHFDGDWYLTQYPDVAANGHNPLVHYLEHGNKEGRNPLPPGEQLDGGLHALPFDSRSKTSAFKRKTIVFVSHDASRTGAPIMLLRAIEAISAGYDVDCISILLKDGEMRTDFERVSSRVLVGEQALQSLALSLLEQGDQSIAICNTLASLSAAELFANASIPVVSWLHEMPTSIDLWLGGGASVRRITDKSQAIVVPSHACAQSVADAYGLDLAKFRVIHNFATYRAPQVDRESIRSSLNIPSNAIIVLGSGYADLRKGVDLFAATARQVAEHRAHVDIYFVWLGHAPDSEPISWVKHDIRASGVSERVQFVPPTTDPQDYYAAADLFFLSSREDPFPNVVLEAMSHSLPVIAFDRSGGASEAIADDSGVVVPYGDIYAAARAIVSMSQSASERQRLGVAAAHKVRTVFTQGQFAQSWKRLLYENVHFELNSLPSVSVIIPSYNHSRFLPERFESIFSQSMQPKEIIFVDDASTDDSIKVAELWRTRSPVPFKIIQHQRNSGSAFLAWKTGIALATGDLIWIAESDDRSAPAFLESLIPAFNASSVVLGYTQSRVIGLEGEIFAKDYRDYTSSISQDRWDAPYIASGKDEVERVFSQINSIPNASAVLVRRHVALSALEGLERFKLAGDWLFYIRCLQHGSIQFVNRSLNDHRRGPTTKTHEVERDVLATKEEIDVRLTAADLFSTSNNQLNRAVAQTVFSYIERSARFDIERPSFYSNLALSAEIQLIKGFLDKRRRLSAGPNILTIIPDLTVGGGQISAIRLANAFADIGNSYLLNTRTEVIDKALFKLIDDRVQFLEGSLMTTPWSGHVGHDSWRVDQSRRADVLSELIKLHGIDTVISHVWWSDRLAYEIQCRTGVKWFIRMHGCYELNMRHPEADPDFADLVRPMFDCCQGVLACSEKNLEIFQAWDIPKPRLVRLLENPVAIDNGDQVEVSLPKAEDEILFCISSRAIEEKGWREAILATQQINRLDAPRRLFKRAGLVLVGEGEHADQLKAEYAFDPSIRFLGRLVHPASVIRQCEIALLPTYFGSESRPMFLAEALALGLPCIATAIGSIPEMLTDEGCVAGATLSLGPDGRVSVADLVEAMLKFMNPVERERAKSTATKIYNFRLSSNIVRDDFLAALGH